MTNASLILKYKADIDKGINVPVNTYHTQLTPLINGNDARYPIGKSFNHNATNVTILNDRKCQPKMAMVCLPTYESPVFK